MVTLRVNVRFEPRSDSVLGEVRRGNWFGGLMSATLFVRSVFDCGKLNLEGLGVILLNCFWEDGGLCGFLSLLPFASEIVCLMWLC